MYIYEFTTPSDPITFKANNDKIAYITAIIVGTGYAGCSRLDDKDNLVKLPTLTAFSGLEPEKLEDEFKKFLGEDFKTFLDNNREEIGEALKSFSYTTLSTRIDYDKALEAITDERKKAIFIADFEDRNRSSMSTWVQNAWKFGDTLLKKSS